MKKIWISLKMFLWMTLLTGVIYPLVITGIAQLTMKQKADGDFVSSQNRVVGATLIGQKFESNRYFWSRPSSVNYNPLPSGGSNLGPTSAALKKAVEERKSKFSTGKNQSIPSELLYASGSGLDPHISLETAYFQIPRVSASRGVKADEIKKLIDRMAEGKQFGFLGEQYVNVLLLNKELDELSKR